MSDKEIDVIKKDEHVEIYDLGNKVGRSVIAVIDTMTQRGAFKGEELSTVGQLRDQCIRVVQIVEEYHSKN